MILFDAGCSSRLWDWEMIELNAAALTNLVQVLAILERKVAEFNGRLPPEAVAANGELAKEIKGHCEKIDLKISSRSTSYLKTALTGTDAQTAITNIRRNIHSELHPRRFYEPLEKYLKYHSQTKLFGDAVFQAMPSANDDIFEAGMCLAFERPTACVLHLMRALEVGLTALAATVGVSKQNDWGSYTRKISEELDRRAKAAGARSLEEQFYAEVASNFDRLRRAYRNPTMHVDKSYSQERAEEILMAVKSFMEHLSSRISEPTV